MRTVIALKQGFYAGRKVAAGTVFQVSDSASGKWFAPYAPALSTEPQAAQAPKTRRRKKQED